MNSTLTTVYKLTNGIQNYHWGTPDAIAKILGRPELINGQPIAEYWIGTHPALPSFLKDSDMSVPQLINHHAKEVLGPLTATNDLPFLLKLLSAQSPLSIQVHPTKTQAILGFEKENQEGIPLDAPHRNYKDANHKPETILALTPFKALAGFKSREEIIQEISTFNCKALNELYSAFRNKEETEFLSTFMQALFNLSENTLKGLIDELRLNSDLKKNRTIITIQELFEFYQYDPGVLMPLLLNTLYLNPGESMFLNAGIPHAYLKGTGVEVMATSDNVLRAGLTPKHIDLNELMSIIDFKANLPNIESCSFSPGIHSLNVPVNDYQVDIIACYQQGLTFSGTNRAEIYLVLDGECTLLGGSYKQGESFLVSATQESIQLIGQCKLVRIYTKL